MVEAGHERTENKRTKVSKGVKFDEELDMKIGTEHSFQKSPEWLKQRLAFFDELYAKQAEKYAGKSFLL